MTQKTPKLTASQVAERLDVSPETVREWGRTGRLRCYLLPSGRMRFAEQDVAAIERGEYQVPRQRGAA